MKYFLLLYFFSAHSFAEYPYQKAGPGYSDRPGSVIEIKPSTPIKAQDGIGLCYGFSATSLLEHHRCSELGSSCNSSDDILSTLDVSSYFEQKRLVEGGHTYKILANLENKRKVAREECVQFSALVSQIVSEKGELRNDESVGWRYLIDRWNAYRGLDKYKDVRRNDCVTCLADDIKRTLVTVPTPKDQIKNAFDTAKTLEDFLYKSLLPAHCLEESKLAIIPPYKTKTFPGYKDTLNVESLSQKVESLLLSNIPLEMGICTVTYANGECNKDFGHSIALFGIKEVCQHSTNKCKTMVKVKNSYGQTWQNQTDGGWVELEVLAKSAIALNTVSVINWIEKPGAVPGKKTFSKFNDKVTVKPSPSPSGGNSIPHEYKAYKGIWKCPGNAFKDQYEAGCVPLR